MNTTEFAILGLLAEGPRSGYDIKKDVEERLSHFWSQSYGHIYPMLRRLEEHGFVAMTVEHQDGRPDRKVYSITADGARALEDAFLEPPSPPLPRNELLLRVFMGRLAPEGRLLRDVGQYRESVERTLASLRSMEKRLQAEAPEQVYWRLTVRYGVAVYEAIAAWCDEAEAELERLRS